MAVTSTFTRNFGAPANPAPVPPKTERVAAKFWLNVGYEVKVQTDEGIEKRFVSLPLGIPLDTQEPFAVTSRNESYSAFQMARNDLLSQIMEIANKLEGGEEKILNLQIQLRRVNSESATIKSEDNPFSMKLNLLAA